MTEIIEDAVEQAVEPVDAAVSGDAAQAEEVAVEELAAQGAAAVPVLPSSGPVVEGELTPEMRLLEAVIFASGEPVTTDLLSRQLGEGSDVKPLLRELKNHYATRGVNLVEINGEWSFRTAADISPYMKITRHPRRKLPRAAAEVLAIIAYHQPVTRADIESIRGVDTSRGTLDILLELGWIRPGKRRDTPGRPLTWATTTEFLSHFNLETLKELPGLDELKAAGLLDPRPVMATLPRESDGESEADIPDEDAEYANWVVEEAENEPESTAAPASAPASESVSEPVGDIEV